MKEITGDLWHYHEAGFWVAITTNGNVRKDGAAVMGRGVAVQAKRRFPDLAHELGDWLRAVGNKVVSFPAYRLYTLPVKHNWWEKADLDLIAASCRELAEFAPPNERVCLVRPGCGNGNLAWDVVRPVIGSILDDRFVVVARD